MGKDNREKNESESASESENTEHTEFEDNENEDTETSEVKKIIPGVIYLSSIPKGMGPVHIRQFMTGFGEVGRIYCAATKGQKKSTHRYKEDDFEEGWVEFKKKKHAKKAAAALNAQPIDSKKKSKFVGQLWNIKYLHKTRWHHLTEQLTYEEQVRKKRMASEIAQAKREAAIIEKNFDASKKMNAITERRKRQGKELMIGGSKFERKMRKVV